MKLLAIDTETTGLDVYHGARPYYVTTCDETGTQRVWEWDVDPFTRRVNAAVEDVLEIIDLLVNQADRVIGQNIKFDVAMLRAAAADVGLDLEWPWYKTEDTLSASHVLASNRPHDLTSLALQYLGKRIDQWEDGLEHCVKRARTWCQHRLKEWRIAKAGLEEMPSAGDKTWKYDGWLPRRLAEELNHPRLTNGCEHVWGVEDRCWICGGHRWWVALEQYADMDSSHTLAVWQVMEQILGQRGLMPHYRFALTGVPIVHEMERGGVTLSRCRLEQQRENYVKESAELAAECVAIAAKYGYELSLPRGGNNNSLKQFCFGRPKEGNDQNPISGPGIAQHWLKLPVVSRTETGQPSLAADALREYLGVLPEDSDQWKFIKALSGKRSRDTALSYLAGYERFWIPWVNEHGIQNGDLFLLHPHLNPCGTDTLRFSSQFPNEQNISKKEGFNLRYCFGPGEDEEWWSFDFKNIERRIPVYECNEEELIRVLFDRPDDPPYFGSDHLLNFAAVYPEIWEKELPEQTRNPDHIKTKYKATYYQWCKNGGFALQYNCGEAKADATFRRPGAFKQLKSKFARMERHNQWCIRFAEEHGYIETVPDRTVDPAHGYPLLCTRTDRGYILNTVPLSYRTQGTAMWLTRKAMVAVDAQLREWRRRDGFDGRIVLQVHDELVLRFPRRGDPVAETKIRGGQGPLIRTRASSNLWRARVIQKLMTETGLDLVPQIPTPVGAEYHPVSWDKGVSL